MSIPITAEKLLSGNIVEWARIEFKEGWNPESTLKTISAFANDIDNWGGGYIVIGVKDDHGKIKKPIQGLDPGSIDRIQKDLLRCCKFLRPVYIPIAQPVEYEGATLLLLWVPGGYERPYLCPKNPLVKNSEKIYYIRRLASTVEASASDLKELMSLSDNIPFDDRVNMKAKVNDLKHPIIRNYLSEVGSALYTTSGEMSTEELAENLRIAGGPAEYIKPVNVGLLFFNEQPERFFPYTRIEVVNIPDPTGEGMEERIYNGPIDQQLTSALAYVKNSVIAEKIFKINGHAESQRVFNYSYDAIEEFLSNAVYHKSYQIHEPVTVRIERDRIEITSAPGPDRSITDEHIRKFEMRSRRYRNRRIGDFLKELHLIEGRNTGIPTAINAIRKNGSPMPEFITDEERTFFSVLVKIHPAFLQDKQIRKRRNTDELIEEILDILARKDKSLNELYKDLGYSGNPSKRVRDIVAELINKQLIAYKITNCTTSSKNVLTRMLGN